MTDTALPTPDATAALDSHHYLEAVAQLGDKRAVTTEAAIYSESGIKLIDKGARIDSRLYGRLLEHKLRDPLDRHLTVEDAVTPAVVQAVANHLLENDPLPRLLAANLASPEPLTAPLKQLRLPSPIAFKLTVMREQQPDLFRHSVQMMLVAVFLGVRTGLDAARCVDLATAALLHDVGVLHMDPAWRDPNHRMSGMERKHLVAHPVTAMLLLRDQGEYGSAIETAVLEHHERLDGSGYPRGLKDAQISRLGRILMLAEVVSAFYEKFDDAAGQRLSLVLRLNHRKFDPVLMACILPLLQGEAAPESLSTLGTEAQFQIERLAQAFDKWTELRAAVPAAELGEGTLTPSRLIDERLAALARVLTEAGSYPSQAAELLGMFEGDAQTLAEVKLMGHEALWQLQGVANACQRRWPQLGTAKPASRGDAAAAAWCARMQELLGV